MCLLFGTTPALQAESSCPSEHIDEWAQVLYVHDGDTVHLNDGRKVRLIGINTPERARDEMPAQPLAEDARTFLLQAIAQSQHKVGLVYGEDKHDRYQRTLAHLFTDNGQNMQAELLEQGLAMVITFPPNTAFTQCYLTIETTARCNQSGIWSHPRYTAIPAKGLNAENKGFAIVNGTVEHISETAKGIWLFMSELMIGIRKENLVHFDRPQLLALKGKKIEVRGWINLKKNKSNKQYKNKINAKYYMRVRHPASIDFNPDARSC